MHSSDVATPPAAHPEPPEPDGPGRIGRFHLVGRLGAGGMGVVYEAYDPRLDRALAVKLVRGRADDAERTARLVREALAMARVSHPNVVPVYDAGEHGDGVYIAMELVRGSTLRHWLRTPRHWRDVVDVFCEAGRGLAAAHRVGIVHRDFKPENVLVDEHGHARVTDFGLALVEGTGGPPLPDSSPRDLGWAQTLASRLSRAGALLGTAPYTAPERHLGQPGDARSDQFSFCVALFEALYGQRPFHGRTLALLVLHLFEGEPSVPTRSVPAWLRRVVLRGLELEPDARFRDMDELVGMLSSHLRRRQQRLIGAAISGVVVLTAGSAYFALAREPPCANVGDPAAEVWHAEARERVRDALVVAAPAFGAATAEHVVAGLDARIERWIATRRDVCEANRIRHERSDELTDLAMTCLDRRLHETELLIERFGHADATAARHAVDAMEAATPIEICVDADRLRTDGRRPVDPTIAEAVAAAEAELDDARVAHWTGSYLDARVHAQAAAAGIEGIDFRPVQAESGLVLAQIAISLGEADTAWEAAHRAVFAAEAGAADETAAALWNELAYVAGVMQVREDAAVEARERALAAIERVGDPPRLLATLESNAGGAAYRLGRLPDAVEHYRRSLALAEQAWGAEHPNVAKVHNSLGLVLHEQGEYAEARPHYERARDLWTAALGPDHPLLARAHSGLGGLAYDEQRFDDALAEHGRALAITEAALGLDHPHVAVSLINLANAYYSLDRAAEAKPLLLRALALETAAKGPDHEDVATVLINLGNIQDDLGDPDAALVSYARAVEIHERRPGDPAAIGYPLAAWADILLMRGDLEGARERFTRAIAALENLGSDHPHVARPLMGLADVALKQGRPAEAVKLLERAVEIRRLRGGDVAEVAAQLERARGELAKDRRNTDE